MIWPDASWDSAGSWNKRDAKNRRIRFQVTKCGLGEFSVAYDGGAAIHGNHLPGQVRRTIARQHQRNLGNFLRLSQVLDRLVFKDFSQTALILPVIFAEHGFHQARRDSVHTHAAGAEFERVTLGHHHQRGLGGAIKHSLKLWPYPRNRSYVNDAPEASLTHARSHQAYQPERAFEVHFDHLVELIIVDGQGRALRYVGGSVVHQNVDTAVLSGHSCYQPLQFLDRKSTRLNSSHRCISYAVFCLKKKK